MSRSTRIAVYGATGYTGAQVAAELKRRGYDPVLAGRDAAGLAAVAEQIGGAETRAAGMDHHETLVGAFDGCEAVLNCVGPFARSAEPVVAAAIACGAHYVDFAAEQEACLELFERWDAPARDAGVAIVPAMGFYGALGDLLASVTTDGLQAVDEVVIAYAVDGWVLTAGSRATASEMAGTRRVWRDGSLEKAEGDVRFGTFDYPSPRGTAPVMEEYPLPEAVIVPRHINTPNVRIVMAASTLQEILSPDAPRPSEVSDARRAETNFVVVASVRSGTVERRTTLTGNDIYGITAPIIVDAAAHLLSDEKERVGVLAPSQAFDARAFLAELHWPGLQVEIAADQGQAA